MCKHNGKIVASVIFNVMRNNGVSNKYETHLGFIVNNLESCYLELAHWHSNTGLLSFSATQLGMHVIHAQT